MDFSHKPVLLDEVINGLDIKPEGIYIDGTVGGAGHSFSIAQRLNGGGRLIGIDRDEDAVRAASVRLGEFGDRVNVIRGNYSEMPDILSREGIDRVNGILLDLGVSSFQLDEGQRGFSYRSDAPLDMRMDRRQHLTAKDIVNDYPEEELRRILKDYGEEACAAGIARGIVRAREAKPIETTFELTDIIKSSVPAKVRNKKGHPAKQSFQAIRIEVNSELEILENSISRMIDLLQPGGRLCIITFHSLEDRIVKNAFKNAEDPCICPKDFPICVCGKKSRGRVITRKAVTAGKIELEENNRAHSAKLRIFERNES